MRKVWLLLALSACAGNSQSAAPDAELSLAIIALGESIAELPQPERATFAPTMTWRNRPDSAGLDAWIAGLDPFGSLRRQRLFPLARRFWKANATPRRIGAVEVPGRGRVAPTRTESSDGVHFTLARVGFAPSGDSALVAFDAICPGLCGSWELWLYVREHGQWQRRENLVMVNY